MLKAHETQAYQPLQMVGHRLRSIRQGAARIFLDPKVPTKYKRLFTNKSKIMYGSVDSLLLECGTNVLRSILEVLEVLLGFCGVEDLFA